MCRFYLHIFGLFIFVLFISFYCSSFLTISLWECFPFMLNLKVLFRIKFLLSAFILFSFFIIHFLELIFLILFTILLLDYRLKKICFAQHIIHLFGKIIDFLFNG